MDEPTQYYLLSLLASKASRLIEKKEPVYLANEFDGCYDDNSPHGVCMTDDCPDSYVVENGTFYLITSSGSHGIDIGGWFVEFCVPDQSDPIVDAILELVGEDIIDRRM